MIYIGLSSKEEYLISKYSLSCSIVQNEKEMYTSVFLDNCTHLVLTTEFINTELRWESLQTFVTETKRIKRNLSIFIIGEFFKMDIEGAIQMSCNIEDHYQVINTVNNYIPQTSQPSDEKKMYYINKLLSNLNDPELLIHYLIREESTVLPILKEVLCTYKEKDDNLVKYKSAIDTLLVESKSLESTILDLNKDIEVLKSNNKKLTEQYDILCNKITTQYKIPLNSHNSNGFNIKVNKYDRILYIKEITRVHYLDTFLYYLQLILNTVNKSQTRSIVIEKEYSYSSARLYPNHKSCTDVTLSDIRNNDLLLTGYQRDILQAVLENPTQCRYLIVLDRSGHDFLAIKGDRVKTLYTLSDIADNEVLNIPDNLLISYDLNTFNIPTIENFPNLSIKERVAEYSSLDITKSIVNSIERG